MKRKQLVLAFVVLDLVGLATWLYFRANPSLDGSLAINIGATANSDFHPKECRNGSAWGFRGVAIRGDSARPSIRIVQAREGTKVLIETDAGEVAVTRDDCKTFSVLVNGKDSPKGTVSLDCELGGKGSVKGRLKFSGCSK